MPINLRTTSLTKHNFTTKLNIKNILWRSSYIFVTVHYLCHKYDCNRHDYTMTQNIRKETRSLSRRRFAFVNHASTHWNMNPHFKTRQITLQGGAGSTVFGIVTSLRAKDPEFDTWHTQQLYLFSKMGRSALGPLSLPINWSTHIPARNLYLPTLHTFWTHPGLINFTVLTAGDT